MDIFEQIDAAHVMVINGCLTTNFGYNADDEPEDWCLSVYGEGEGGSFEYYFGYDDVAKAVRVGDHWSINCKDLIEFCLLVPVDS